MNSDLSFPRRTLLKLTAGAVSAFSSLGFIKSAKANEMIDNKNFQFEETDSQECPGSDNRTARALPTAVNFPLGRYPMIQAATSADTTFINVLVPRLRTFKYEVESPNSRVDITPYEVSGMSNLHFKVDRLKITNLRPGVTYTIKPYLESGGKRTYSDERQFKSLDPKRPDLSILFGSCLCEEDYFSEVMGPMWNRIMGLNPDLLLLVGDLVYVDSFNYVEREKATETDIWLRYIESVRNVPLWRSKKLIPVFAGWDDHDAGTNNAHRDSPNISVARKMFQRFFLGQSIPGVYEQANDGIYWTYKNETLDLFLIDDRSFKQPPVQFETNANAEEPFSLLGQQQHEWLMSQLRTSQKPAFILCGTQFVNGAQKNFIESFDQNRKNYERFVNDVRSTKRIVVYGSGDIHLSEVQTLGTEAYGFPLYEITSSSIHSFTGKAWDNPKRLAGTANYNAILLRPKSEGLKSLKMQIVSWGIEEKSYFDLSMSIQL